MSNKWTIGEALLGYLTENPSDVAAQTLAKEFTRLAKQECAYCNGFGHSANDCPTDLKLQQLRVGVQEQTQYVLKLRKLARAKVKMSEVTGFSLLSGRQGWAGNNGYKKARRKLQ